MISTYSTEARVEVDIITFQILSCSELTKLDFDVMKDVPILTQIIFDGKIV